MPETPPITSDFYDLEALLPEEDRAVLHRVREFMDEQVQPIINEYWTRAEFPKQLIPEIAKLGIAGSARGRRWSACARSRPAGPGHPSSR